MKQALSVRERRKYRDISWLMPAVDVPSVLKRLGVDVESAYGGEVSAYCPDHHIFTGRAPSHPKWTCSMSTGETYCFTEPRGSNILWTVCRLLGCDPGEAVEFMTGKDEGSLSTAILSNRLAKLMGTGAVKKVEDGEVKGLDSIGEDLKNRFISDACYQYFIHPPDKKPTNIRKETVDQYQVFERRWGYYANRAIVPYFLRGELIGFCAIDILGKKNWLLEHPMKTEDDYRKTLYPMNFKSGMYLFGFDDCQKAAPFVVVTEGSREVMKLRQEGFPNSVACLKAELGEDQILMLGELAPRELVLMFDGDKAGYAATDKMARTLSGLFLTRKCFLPPGKDPKQLEGKDYAELIKRSKIA
jgi:hypothetical protein